MLLLSRNDRPSCRERQCLAHHIRPSQEVKGASRKAPTLSGSVSSSVKLHLASCRLRAVSCPGSVSAISSSMSPRAPRIQNTDAPVSVIGDLSNLSSTDTP